MFGKALDLVGLSVENVGHVPQLLIDGLLVVGVDQWGEKHGGDGNERETPERKEHDKEVGEQGRSEGLEAVSNQALRKI